MRSNKSDPDHLIEVIDSYNQSVLVSFDVKYNSAIPQNTCRWILLFDLVRILPFTCFGFPIPRFKLLFTIWMLCPKLTEYFLGNDPQIIIFPQRYKEFPYWELSGSNLSRQAFYQNLITDHCQLVAWKVNACRGFRQLPQIKYTIFKLCDFQVESLWRTLEAGANLPGHLSTQPNNF